jgi:7-keto-8-aminopelargonate synthetase-like enzyme
VVHKQSINNVNNSNIKIKSIFKYLVEQRIAKFHQREDAILYISCFDANAGIFETLLKEQDYIISVRHLP